LAWLIAGVLGSTLATWSFALIMWLSVIPQILCIIVSFQLIEPSIHKEKPRNTLLHLKTALSLYKNNKKLRYLSLANIIAYGIGESSFQFQPIFYNSLLPVWAAGYMISLNSLISTISSRLSGRVIDKFKAINLLIFQEIYGRCVNIFALAVPTIFSPLLMALSSIPYGPGEVAKSMLLQQEFTDQQRATMASINSLVRNCLYALVAFLIGLTADKWGASRTLLVAQICLFPVLWLYVKVFHNARALTT